MTSEETRTLACLVVLNNRLSVFEIGYPVLQQYATVHNNFASKNLPVSTDSTDLELLWVLVKSEEASTIVGALYHPPKSTCSYPPLVLYNFLEDSLEELLMQNHDASVILGGDFNELNVAEVTARTSLVPLVHTPTRGKNILDMLMTSLPQLHQIKVVASAVRSDHKAI